MAALHEPAGAVARLPRALRGRAYSPAVPEQEMTALAGEPVPVEFCHDGTWYSAVLLGWRHREDGSCDVRVRLVSGGLRRSTWLPLREVRLAAADTPTPAPSTIRPDRDWSRPLGAVPPPGRPDEDRSPV